MCVHRNTDPYAHLRSLVSFRWLSMGRQVFKIFLQAENYYSDVQTDLNLPYQLVP